jgi:hypothetical protein
MPPPKKPLQESDLTDKKVWDLLGKASRLELNIYSDQNLIIKLLCRALLRARGKDPSKNPHKK